MTRTELLTALTSEHFGHYTRPYTPVPQHHGDDDPGVIAARRAAIDIDHADQQEDTAA